MRKDKTDDKIIGFLRDDARESFVEIGKKLKLSESAIRRRVKNLVDSGVIEKFTVEMGETNTTSAIVLISVDSATDTSTLTKNHLQKRQGQIDPRREIRCCFQTCKNPQIRKHQIRQP